MSRNANLQCMGLEEKEDGDGKDCRYEPILDWVVL